MSTYYPPAYAPTDSSPSNDVLALRQEVYDLRQRLAALENEARTRPMTPVTGLTSPNFFKRAFTAWGYVFVASLVINMVLFGCFFAFVMVGVLSMPNV